MGKLLEIFRSLFGPSITIEDLFMIFPCDYCGQPRHKTFKEGVDCAWEFYEKQPVTYPLISKEEEENVSG